MTKAKRIFVSNRLPFSINSKTGNLKRGSGGLVSALLGVRLDEPFYWLGFETDAQLAKQLKAKSHSIDSHLNISPVVLDKKLYESYYDRFSNDVLWPLFHYEGHHVLFRREDWNSYTVANQAMADEILNIAEDHDTVWIHDFHFMLLPQMLKQKKPSLKVGFFLHTPFPSAEIFRQLPVREEILNAIIHADLIGFHEHSFLRHFTVSLKALLGIDSSFFRAEIGDHTLQLGVYPISIDNKDLREKAASKKVQDLVAKYQATIESRFLILGVDRLDYSKGLELKLRGFRRLLQKYPELRGQINLLQVAIPTRTKVPAYIRLKKEIDQLVGTINGEFGQPGYTPVQYIYNSVTENELLALYRRADCVLIASKRDGMNLVAIEYAVAQCIDHPGVIVLSEFAGAASLLGEAIFINPWDEDSIADALHKAYQMPFEEKRSRLEYLQDLLSKYSATQWAESFLRDLERMNRSGAQTPKTLVLTEKSYVDVHNRIASAKKCALVLDYDGTLVQLQKRPEMAIIPGETLEYLKKINERMELYIVSGRTKEFLDRQFPNAPFPLAAEHGAFYKEVGGTWRSRISSDIQSWYPEVQKVLNSYAERVPLSFVEHKEAALVWHYRLSPEDFASYQARKLDEELQVGLANLPVAISAGSKVVEAKAIECDKGNFLRWLMDEDKEDKFVICIGDDRTDEDMFRILGRKGISIKVGTEKLTAAQYRIPTQKEVIHFLKNIAEM